MDAFLLSTAIYTGEILKVSKRKSWENSSTRPRKFCLGQMGDPGSLGSPLDSPM